jgi:zinc/manganese transport system permease protein
MMLPAIAARHWAAALSGQVYVSVGLALLASVGGLLVSYHADIPAGPAIVLAAGGLWAASLLAGRRDSLMVAVRRGQRPRIACHSRQR